MRRSIAVALLVGVTAGCSSGSTSSGGTSEPAVCSSTDALQASVADLRNVQVAQNGIAALQDSVAAVRSNLQQVAHDAKSQYSTQVDQLQAGVDQLQAAAGTAQRAPSADTLNAVTASIRTLGDEVRGFADDVASTC
jgi:glutamine synthetase type III